MKKFLNKNFEMKCKEFNFQEDPYRVKTKANVEFDFVATIDDRRYEAKLQRSGMKKSLISQAEKTLTG